MKSGLLIAAIWVGVLALSFSAEAKDVKITDLVTGEGERAGPGKVAEVHYSGWLEDGKKFDSSLDRNETFHFVMGGGQVIPGWDKGVEGMKVGGKRRLIIPPHLAYGPAGAGGVIPPNATLKFEIELIALHDLPYTNISVDELQPLLDQGIPIVDIRTEAEWRKTGVVENSHYAVFRKPNGRINQNFPQDLRRIAKPNEPVILICRTGNRTERAAQALSQHFGYENIYNVEGGITDWIKKGNPVVPYK